MKRILSLFSFPSLSRYWNSLSIRRRRILRRFILGIFILIFILCFYDYFWGLNFFPFSDYFKWRIFNYEDHIPSYFFFGLMATLGVVISIYILMAIQSKEAKTLSEYLDIFNDILEDIENNKNFYILSPAHNAGQRDNYKDPAVKKKYELNQKLLKEKSEVAKGEYTLLKFNPNELSVMSSAVHSEKSKMLEDYEKNKNSHSSLFKFLMNFSTPLKYLENEDHLITIEKYMHEAFLNLNNLISNGLTVRMIKEEAHDYLEAPLVLIITERAAYFGLYRLTDKRSDALIRGIKLTDKDGIDTLKVLYNAMISQFSVEFKPQNK